MLHTTKGIAVHTIKFSETSIIAKIYTERFGFQSYLIKGIRRQHSKIKPGLFQPLTLLELTVYHKEKRNLQVLKDAHIYQPYQSLQQDVLKSSISLFMAELIYKSIAEEESNPELFNFLLQACLRLDQYDGSLSITPVYFTLLFSRFLGIIPQMEAEPDHQIFNLKEGQFQRNLPEHRYFIEPPLTTLLKRVLYYCQEEQFDPAIIEQNITSTATQRSELLEHLLTYYKLHLPGFRDLNSHRILHSVLA